MTGARPSRPGGAAGAAIALFLALAAPWAARADESVGEQVSRYLDEIDFNNYALSLNVYRSLAVYEGVDNSTVLYPLLSSNGHATMTDTTLFVRDGMAGLRAFAGDAWQFGGVVKVQADGYGPGTSDRLSGMERRGWTVAGGGYAGRRLGPFQADLFAVTDLLGEHGGNELDFKFALPLAWPAVQFVPQVEATYQDADYISHYFGVRPSEATADRPVYTPGGATTWAVSADVIWRFANRWSLRGGLSYNFLPGEIANSPVVDVERSWSVNAGVAYGAPDFFAASKTQALDMGLDVGLELFFMNARTAIDLRGSTFPEGVRLENSSSFEEREIAWPVDVRWRFGRYHSLGFRYFELFRDGRVELQQDRTIFGVPFSAGEELVSNLGTRVLRLDYGFALLRDSQKEFMLIAGLHATDVDYGAAGDVNRVEASTTAVLPMLGARLRVNWTDRIALLVNAEIFALDFNKYTGELLDLSGAFQYRLLDTVYIEGGFRYYRQRLESGDESFAGEARIDYAGPYVGISKIFGS
jgi:outer membrane scaffolding protein for murein synthesis (MipA/OmpV family)